MFLLVCFPVQPGVRLGLRPLPADVPVQPRRGRRGRRGGRGLRRHAAEGPAELLRPQHLTIRERLPESHQRAQKNHQGLFPHTARLQAKRQLN